LDESNSVLHLVGQIVQHWVALEGAATVRVEAHELRAEALYIAYLCDLLSLELLPPPQAAIKAAPTPAEAEVAMNRRLPSPRVQ
jgi:hypothetical protein